jgi:hypothetical protein
LGTDWENIARLLSLAGPSVIPLIGALLFSNIYLDAEPNMPFYHYVAGAAGFISIICGILFITKITFNWPPIVDVPIRENNR